MTFSETMTQDARFFEVDGHNDVLQCSVCGTHVRKGQSHRTDVYPAHASLRALIVYARLNPDEHYVGRLDHTRRRH